MFHPQFYDPARAAVVDRAGGFIVSGNPYDGIVMPGSQPLDSALSRFPFLRDSPELLKYLADRNIAVFSTDIDSFDFKGPAAPALVKHVMSLLEKRGKGIILMHDIQPHTAAAMPDLLKELKAKGYKIVQLTAKAPVQTLPEYDAKIESDIKGMPTALSDRPMTSVIKTIGGQ